ncbi:family 16 glycosylhydrolase [Variovorax sp. CAN2819]|uniref:family 16 glycosylhydrolase n=1 Tax=Variovorax sp. CAN15 TaxID=3046727 RepID=UPI002649D5BC|nr:family 16 glycosylhydrolase [Variovorax sp. CAN15]MDN6885071.1 family 16 glycosylhydrolase [Variovorax sp. CAN15]
MQSDRPVEQSAIPEKSRRQFLQKGAQAATALLGTSAIGACGGGGSSGAGSEINSAALLPSSANPAGAISPESSAAPPAAAMPSPAKSPVIHSFSPGLAMRGDVVVITGAEFDSGSTVRFGEVVATKFSVDSANQISVTVPDSAKDAPIFVRAAGGETRSSKPFEVALVPAAARNYRLVWRDEFEGNALDRTKWTPLTNQRDDAFQTAEAVTVSGSVMKITTYTDPSTGRHHTGFLRTAGRYEFCFGYVEARVRFASAPGQWGAFWLMSNQNRAYTPPNPAAGVEIDIIEQRAIGGGNMPDLRSSYSSAVHWNGYQKGVHLVDQSNVEALPQGQSFKDWHTLGLLWTPQGYEFYLDGAPKPYWTTDKGLSLSNEFIKLTCEIRDKDWAGDIPPDGYGPLGASTNGIMEVDWVRVWQQ